MPDPTLKNLFGGTYPTELYLEWHEYFDSGYCWPSSSQKLIRIGFYDESFPESRKEFGYLVQTSNGDVNIQYFCGQWGNTTNCNVSGAVYSGEAHPTNQWVKWGYWLKLNTSGSSNGFIKVYKNDVLYLDTGNVSLIGNDTKGVNFLWVGGNYSMLGGGTAACSGHRYIDDVAIYSTQPTASTTAGGSALAIMRRR